MHEAKKLLKMLNQVLPPYDTDAHIVMLLDDKLVVQLSLESGFHHHIIAGEDLHKKAAEIVVAIMAAMVDIDNKGN